MKILTMAIAAMAFSTVAWGWEYQVIEAGIVIYADQEPPQGIGFPPAGAAGEIATEGDDATDGQPISAKELAERLARPHLVIIPSQTER